MPKFTTPHEPAKKAEGGEAVEAISNRVTPLEEFARRLYDAIRERGWNQSDLARAAGLKRDAISTYINARHRPSPEALDRLSQALGVRPEDLMPLYYDSGVVRVKPRAELIDVPNSKGYMWLKLDMRLPRDVAMRIFMKAQEHVV